MEDNIRLICEENVRKWCILRHPESAKIAKVFRGEVDLSTDDDHPMPPFDYYIPADDVDTDVLKSLGQVSEYAPYDPTLDEDALRRDLSHFIFICADSRTTGQILDANWARSLRQRISVYRDRDYHPIEISGKSLFQFSCVVRQQGFMTAMSQSGSCYQDIQDGETVRVIAGPMEGNIGVVTGFVEHDGQLLLTLRMEMFAGQRALDVPGFNIFDVRHIDEDESSDSDDDLTVPLIVSFENRIIEYLSHLHGRGGSQQRNQADHRQLRTILRYADADIHFPEPDGRQRFKAIILLCAYLLNDKAEIDKRLEPVEQLLAGHKAPVSHLDCYLTIILFIVTHRPSLRHQYKSWLQSHPDCPLPLRRFHAIAKLIHC
ncbi:MAG: hypothetical protein IJ588_01630 [Prevotella sp.]|nr:hypothetical protein [Prevotella sp.]